MNQLEIMAIRKLTGELREALDGTREKDRYEHTVPFARSHIKNAIKIIKALEENGKKEFEKYDEPGHLD